MPEPGLVPRAVRGVRAGRVFLTRHPRVPIHEHEALAQGGAGLGGDVVDGAERLRGVEGVAGAHRVRAGGRALPPV